MHTWTPLFSKIVDSSLWVEEDYVVKVFITMLALKDADQVVRVNAFGLGRRCWPMDKDAEERVLKALKVLESPDKRRKEPQPHEGRRIERVEGGWKILNGQEYENLMRDLNRKAYKAAKQKEYRLKLQKLKEAVPLPGEAGAIAAERRGDTVTPERLAAEPSAARTAREPDTRPMTEDEWEASRKAAAKWEALVKESEPVFYNPTIIPKGVEYDVVNCKTGEEQSNTSLQESSECGKSKEIAEMGT